MSSPFPSAKDPMRRLTIKAALFGMIVLASTGSAHAWSSRASRTATDIRGLSTAIELYRSEVGRLPPPDRIWDELRTKEWYRWGESGPPLDDWKRPLVYRAPGKHGDFDLYSVGADGVDDDGELDDISNWVGVNDGFHWKSTWPRGRSTIALGVLLGLSCLLFALVYPWRLVAPLAASLICGSTILGTQWLMHPGVVPSRNLPLVHIQGIASCALVFLIACLFLRAKRTVIQAVAVAAILMAVSSVLGNVFQLAFLPAVAAHFAFEWIAPDAQYWEPAGVMASVIIWAIPLWFLIRRFSRR
jgi:general secretion pathway protein G